MKIAVLLVAAVVASSGAAWASAGAAPTLRLMDRTPVVVRGTGFDPQERVAVSLSSGSHSSKTVQATAGGGFVVRFKTVLGGCARYTIQAYGSHGSRALLRSRIALDCVSNR
jgi:hypothetical protein